MSVNDGLKAVKEERRVLVRRLRQIDSIVAGFANLASTRPRTNSKPPEPKKARKSSGRPRKVARMGKPEASLAAAAQD